MNHASNATDNGKPLKRRAWEKPLGVIRGYLEETDPPEIDPYDAMEREAIEWLENKEEKKWNK